MALNYKGQVSSLPVDGLSVNDAYLLTGTGYQYYDGSQWQAYTPIKVIDDLALTKVYEGKGTPTVTSNSVQFPTVDMGTFYLDATTGDVWAYVPDTTGWIKW